MASSVIRGIPSAARGMRRALAARAAARPAARLAAGGPRRAAATASLPYAAVVAGEAKTESFRIFLEADGKRVSPWHGVPLYPNGKENEELSFICEIPKETQAKMEVATDEALTPIKQDTKKGKLRDYPYNIHWNYGMLPQTWEDPGHKNEATDCFGDNDPMDVVEIGSVTGEMGAVYTVKPLGVLAMIDDGEIDWKLLALRTDDPKAAAVSTLEDVEREFPGEMDRIREWFRDYKVPDGKPQNKFGLDEKWMPKDYAMGIVRETAAFYDDLVSGKTENSKGLSLE